MAVISAFSRCLVPPVQGEVTPPDPVANKNWNPGNYIASGTTNNDSVWNAMVARLNNTNDPQGHWKGVMIRLAWTQLEGATLGSYTAGFDKVKSYLDQIAAFPGRKLIVFIQLKSFGDGTPSVPLYMRNGSNAAYNDPDGRGNGQYAYASGNGGNGGTVPNIHVNAVRDRLTALMTAFGERFNDNPNLEAIIFSEAALGTPRIAPGSFSKTTWTNKMAESFEAMRPALSNIQICQWINDRQVSVTFVPQLRTAGVGLGMTDLCSNDAGFHFRDDIPNPQNPGNIQHCQESNGLAIIVGHVSNPASNGSVANRCQASGAIQGQPTVYPAYPGPAFTKQQLRDFAVNTVGITHLLWFHITSNHPAAGSFDAAVPVSCEDTAGPYQFVSDSITGAYNGKPGNLAIDNWIHNAGSTITTVTARPAGWT